MQYIKKWYPNQSVYCSYQYSLIPFIYVIVQKLIIFAGTESIICHVFCSENMGIYDDIDADVLRNYQEFALVNIIYYGLKESTTSEQSARMTAMDSASKNACESFYTSLFQFQTTLTSFIYTPC